MAWYWWLLLPVALFVVLWVFLVLLWLIGYMTERGKDQYHRMREQQERKSKGREATDDEEDDDGNGIHPMNRSPYEADK